jgi:hypothetical protein
VKGFTSLAIQGLRGNRALLPFFDCIQIDHGFACLAQLNTLKVVAGPRIMGHAILDAFWRRRWYGQPLGCEDLEEDPILAADAGSLFKKYLVPAHLELIDPEKQFPQCSSVLGGSKPSKPERAGIVLSKLRSAGVIPAEPIALLLCERVWSGEKDDGSAGL